VYNLRIGGSADDRGRGERGVLDRGLVLGGGEERDQRRGTKEWRSQLQAIGRQVRDDRSEFDVETGRFSVQKPVSFIIMGVGVLFHDDVI
jgi:hypothetical protein